MKHSTRILAAAAIAPFVLLMGCSDGDMGMDEFEEQQMQEQPEGGEGGMQSAPPPEGSMQEPPQDGEMQQPPSDGGMEPEGDNNF
ncbi:MULTISPECIES: hypothetical protein [unclassified Thioalkalivibrio]|uniref:hypothetical protein n=1 Tax=unclassified Thioalkalivibrio TaxID=2621013 RepID=UPI000373E3E0|nr:MULTISPECIES: hypothetical protein [unclassified Thioalkalivibrio]